MPLELLTKQNGAWIPRILLIAYSIVLTIRGTASLQAILVLSSFFILLYQKRNTLRDTFNDLKWIWWPLVIFSLWVFLTCPWWPSIEGVSQPGFGLDQWRRDIGQPMLALLSGYWAFRESSWRNIFFVVQGCFLILLLFLCLYQFYLGDWSFEGPLNLRPKGSFQVRALAHDINFFSYVLLLLLPAPLILILNRDSTRNRWFGLGVLLVLLMMAFLNKRRGLWIAMSVESLILIWWFQRKYLLFYFMGFLVLIFGAYQLRPQWFIRDYDHRKSTYNMSSRMEIVKKVPKLLMERPWVGVGFGKNTVVKNYWHRIFMHTHNTFTNMALAIGIPGLLFWLFALFQYGLRFAREVGIDTVSKIGFLLLIGMCVRCMTDDIWVSSIAELFWLMLGVLMPSRKESK